MAYWARVLPWSGSIPWSAAGRVSRMPYRFFTTTYLRRVFAMPLKGKDRGICGAGSHAGASRVRGTSKSTELGVSCMVFALGA
jgi:hypothetical protein